jgi:hypothetical protein
MTVKIHAGLVLPPQVFGSMLGISQPGDLERPAFLRDPGPGLAGKAELPRGS